MSKKLDKIFRRSKRMTIDDNSKIVIMSDCHRGSGDNYDNFFKNRNIFLGALNYYFSKEFAYIELGDGDEMWEVRNYENIITEHIDVFKKIKLFNDKNRLIMIYGNHDIVKRIPSVLKKYFYSYYDVSNKEDKPLLDGLEVKESLVLNYKEHDIFLIHGHQVDFLNGTLWRLSRFLVKHIWRFFERIGIKDPTGAAKSSRVTNRREKRLEKWSLKNNKILISGHTHRAIFPKIGHSLYFNDGSCIHPNGITSIEIEDGKISLVKWVLELNEEGTLGVQRKVLDGRESIINFFYK